MIALLTDFGLADPWVGIMKGVIASRAPSVPTVDLTHAIPPQDVRLAALHLEAAWRWFPEGTVFLCVVDPGVGTARRPLVLRCASRLFVGPDNGVFSLLPDPEHREITAPWGLPNPSATFHGRDLFAPVAARLATGARFEDVGPLLTDPVRLPFPPAETDGGVILYFDRFGNAVTNLRAPPADPSPGGGRIDAVQVQGRRLPLVRAYGDAAVGEAVALVGSTGRVELAVRNGNAEHGLGLSRDTEVRWLRS